MDILRTTLAITRSEHSETFYAETEVKPPPMSVTVVGIGRTIKDALVDLANQLGDSLDPDTED